jgi:hypothetical protein
MPAKVVKFCDGSYDALCEECGRALCEDQPYPVADRLVANHNELFHEHPRLPFAKSSTKGQ